MCINLSKTVDITLYKVYCCDVSVLFNGFVSFQICDEFREISYKLRERANTIEDLTEQRDYIKTVPESMASYQSRIDQAMSDYDTIEEYFYPLSDEEFNNR